MGKSLQSANYHYPYRSKWPESMIIPGNLDSMEQARLLRPVSPVAFTNLLCEPTPVAASNVRISY